MCKENENLFVYQQFIAFASYVHDADAWVGGETTTEFRIYSVNHLHFCPPIIFVANTLLYRFCKFITIMRDKRRIKVVSYILTTIIVAVNVDHK